MQEAANERKIFLNSRCYNSAALPRWAKKKAYGGSENSLNAALSINTFNVLTSCAGGRQNMPRPCKLTFDLLTLKVVFESHVTWATSVPILVFLGLSVLDLRPIYAIDRQTDRQTDVRRASSFNAPTLGAGT